MHDLITQDVSEVVSKLVQEVVNSETSKKNTQMNKGNSEEIEVYFLGHSQRKYEKG